MFLPLLLALSQPEPSLLLTCDQFEWLSERTMKTESLSIWKKVEFIARYKKWTDPVCFTEVKE